MKLTTAKQLKSLKIATLNMCEVGCITSDLISFKEKTNVIITDIKNEDKNRKAVSNMYVLTCSWSSRERAWKTPYGFFCLAKTEPNPSPTSTIFHKY